MEMSLWSFHHLQELIGGKFSPELVQQGPAKRGMCLGAGFHWNRVETDPVHTTFFEHDFFCLYLQFVELYTLVHSYVIIFLTAYANVISSFAYCHQNIAVFRQVVLYV